MSMWMRAGLVPLILTVGCSETNIGSSLLVEPSGEALPVESVSNTDVLVQVASPKVDTLFVVDNSGSMEDEQAALADNFRYFIRFFLDSGLDFHIGVTSTDMDGVAGPNGTQGRLRTVQGQRFLTPETPNATQVFTAMAVMGTNGSASERGLPATYAALELLRDEDNAGFYRDDATLHTAVVTDEPSQRRGDEIRLAEFIDWYDAQKDSNADRTFSSIIDPTDGGEYARVTQQIGGIEWDIRDDRWRTVLERLGLQAAGLRSEYHLSQRPVPGTIEVFVEEPVENAEGEFNRIQFEEAVRVGDVIVNDDPTLTWDYEPDRNSITFVEYVPPALARVVITYDLLAANVDDVAP